MIDSSILIVRRAEEVIDVLVLRDVALDEGDSWQGFREFLGGGDVDVAHDHFGAVVREDLDCSSSDAGRAASDHGDAVAEFGEGGGGGRVVGHCG